MIGILLFRLLCPGYQQQQEKEGGNSYEIFLHILKLIGAGIVCLKVTLFVEILSNMAHWGYGRSRLFKIPLDLNGSKRQKI
jgi:hypothetical protein